MSTRECFTESLQESYRSEPSWVIDPYAILCGVHHYLSLSVSLLAAACDVAVRVQRATTQENCFTNRSDAGSGCGIQYSQVSDSLGGRAWPRIAHLSCLDLEVEDRAFTGAAGYVWLVLSHPSRSRSNVHAPILAAHESALSALAGPRFPHVERGIGLVPVIVA